MAKTRSPNYPAISLRAAIQFVKMVWDEAQRHPVPLKTVVEDYWELATSSSRGHQIVGALRAFGLIETEGRGTLRLLRVSDIGAKIVSGHSESPSMIRTAAIIPKVHGDLWARYSASGLPPDRTIEQFLIHDYNPPFNKATVGKFIAQFRDTISFAELAQHDILDDDDSTAENAVFKENDDSTKHEQPSSIRRIKPVPGTKQEIFALDQGEVVIQWPTSLTEADYEDIEPWIDILKRKIKRCVHSKPPGESDADSKVR